MSTLFVISHILRTEGVPWMEVWGARDGALVRALTSHQCGPGSNPDVDAICGLSLLLVLSFAPRGFSPRTLVFPSPQKPRFPNSNSIRNQGDEEPLCGCATSESLLLLLLLLSLLNPGLRKKKCPFFLNSGVPSIEVIDTKIMRVFLRDQISCPLNKEIPWMEVFQRKGYTLYGCKTLGAYHVNKPPR